MFLAPIGGDDPVEGDLGSSTKNGGFCRRGILALGDLSLVLSLIILDSPLHYFTILDNP